MNIKFPWKWYLRDGYPAAGSSYHGSRVFSCFSCGGGSSMGYKLAGYDLLGGLEIDKKIAEIYSLNHHPRFMYNEDIRSFLTRSDIKDELFGIDILDGSPPCTPFSMAGIREEGWGVERNYAEGRIKQTLDDLFLVFIELIKKLQPKIAVIENVLGLNVGTARTKYLPLIGNTLRDAGYDFIIKQLDSSIMGVPQKRERLFFLCVRKDIQEIKREGLFKNIPSINLKFNQDIIPSKEILDNSDISEQLNTKGVEYWSKCKQGNSFSTVSGGGWYSQKRLSLNLPTPTLVASCNGQWHPTICRQLNKQEWINASSFPQDYNFMNKHYYIIGNSVPPVMMANIADQIYKQWLSKI